MNQRIQKAIDDIERTKAKIAELQALLPELERKRTDLENTEILRLVRSANVAPSEIAAFVESIKNNRQEGRAHGGRNPRADTPAIKNEEAADDDEA
jgi:predicted  nucleic acid-binding Zn-ribbon protein